AVGRDPHAAGALLPADTLQQAGRLVGIVGVGVQASDRRTVQPAGDEDVAEPGHVLVDDARLAFADGAALLAVDGVEQGLASHLVAQRRYPGVVGQDGRTVVRGGAGR